MKHRKQYPQANKHPIQLRSHPKRFIAHDFSNKKTLKIILFITM